MGNNVDCVISLLDIQLSLRIPEAMAALVLPLKVRRTGLWESRMLQWRPQTFPIWRDVFFCKLHEVFAYPRPWFLMNVPTSFVCWFNLIFCCYIFFLFFVGSLTFCCWYQLMSLVCCLMLFIYLTIFCVGSPFPYALRNIYQHLYNPHDPVM